jgi:EmrB/QacA subfamily drug resistance transporter
MPTLYIAGYIILVIVLFVIINLALRRGRNQNNKAEANVHKEPSEEAIMLNLADKQEKIDTALLTDNKDLPQITEEEEEYKVDSLNLAEREKDVEKKNAFPVVWTTSEETNEAIKETLQEAPNSPSAMEYVAEPAGHAKETGSAQSQKGPDLDSKHLHRGKLIGVLLFGAFIAILNQTLLNVAIPHIMNDLGVSATTVQWLSTGYMLVNGIMIPLVAFLIARFGTRNLFITSMFLFSLGTIICSISTSFSMLMIGRVVQAAGAGIVMPLMMTVFMTVFPPEKRGAAMGIMGIAMIFAPAVGPTLSGWIVQYYSWRLLFDVVIPFAVLDLILAVLWMKDVTKITKPKFDYPGVIFSTIGFGFLLYGFSEAGNDGWSSGTVVTSLIVGIVGIVLFAWRELTADSPMLDLRVFKYDIFTLTTIINMISNMAMFGAMLLLPIYLQNIRGYTALQSGLLIMPGAVIMGIMSPISGRLFDKMGSRPLAIFGLAITAITTYQFTHLTMSTSYTHIMMLYIFRSFGMSFLMTTVMTEGMNQLPLRLTSHGTAASNTARTVAGSIGTAFLVTVMTTRSDFHTNNFGNIVNSSNGYITSQLGALGQGIAQTAGLPASSGQSLALVSLYGDVVKQSTIEGINDAFFYATGITLIALILAFFVKRSKFARRK